MAEIPESNKTDEMKQGLDDLSEAVFGRKWNQTDECVTCGSKRVGAEDFDDDLRRKEYSISHMCQACQDGVFLGGAEDD